MGIGAERCLFERPWPTQACMCVEQAFVSATSSQSRWKAGNQTQKHTSDISYKTLFDQRTAMNSILPFLINFSPFVSLGLWIARRFTMPVPPPLNPCRQKDLPHTHLHPKHKAGSSTSPSPFPPSIFSLSLIPPVLVSSLPPSSHLIHCACPRATKRTLPDSVTFPVFHWLTLVTCCLLPSLIGAGETWGVVSACPFHCVCRNLSESLSTLCADKGLLFVPPHVDRRTVELRLADNFIMEVGGSDFVNMTGLVDLTLSRNTIHLIRPLAFADLESLRSLHLDGEIPTEVPLHPHDVSNVYKVLIINISWRLGNRLTTIGPRDLAGLVNLQHLIVNNNQLVKVSVQAFDDFLLTLEDLDMSYNNLRR